MQLVPHKSWDRSSTTVLSRARAVTKCSDVDSDFAVPCLTWRSQLGGCICVIRSTLWVVSYVISDVGFVVRDDVHYPPNTEPYVICDIKRYESTTTRCVVSRNGWHTRSYIQYLCSHLYISVMRWVSTSAGFTQCRLLLESFFLALLTLAEIFLLGKPQNFELQQRETQCELGCCADHFTRRRGAIRRYMFRCDGVVLRRCGFIYSWL